MPFSLSGSTITQTGTDNDLSDLEGISGVTTTTSGHQNVYTLDNRRLIIQGTLNINPDIEVLITNYNGNSAMLVTGTLNFGTETIVNGNRRLSGGVGLVFTGISTTNQRFWRANDNGSLVIQGPNGVLNALGGVMISSRPFGFYTNNITVNIDNTRFIKAGVGTERREFRFDEDQIINGTVTNAIIDGFQLSHRSTPSGGMSVVMQDAEIVQLSGGPTLTVLNNIDISNNIAIDTDFGTDDNQGVARNYEVTNTSNGSALRLMPKSGVGNNRQRGYLRIFKELEFIFSDPSSNELSGIKLYSIDNDNGFRKNTNGLNSLNDKIYQETSSSAGVVELTVETAITNIDSEGNFNYSDWDTTFSNNRFKVDRRGLDDSTDDNFRFHFGSYEHVLSETVISCKGLDESVIRWTLFEDNNIIENKSIVDAYNTIDNFNKFYDRAKSFLIDNWGNYLELIVLKEGQLINAQSYNIIVNPNATSAFSFDGTTITIKTDIFEGGLLTTGTVTLLNGATVTGSVTDMNGTQTNTSLTGLQDGTEVRIYRHSDSSEFGVGIESSVGGTARINYTYIEDTLVYIQILSEEYENITLRNINLTESPTTIPIQQRFDRNFLNP